MHYDLRRVTALCGCGAIHLGAIISEGAMLFAILLFVRFTAFAFAAGIDKAADAGVVADFESFNFFANTCDATDDLVPGNHGESGIAPLAASLVDVGVANSAVSDFDQNIIGAWFATLEGERGDG